MPVYLVTGRLGSGKTLVSVGRIRDALLSGRRVATNLDLFVDKLLPARVRQVDVVRLPDRPTARDLFALGIGNEQMDEEKNGLLVLDELGTWLNSRGWNDKERTALIDWMIHARKYGWDVMLIAQHLSQIDKQVREALVEFHVVCRRLDRLKVPFVGRLLQVLSSGVISGNMPKIHFGVCRYGTSHDAVVAERWLYMGRDLYGAYSTRQVFSVDAVAGAFSYLSPWHLVGRFQESLRSRIATWWRGSRRSPPRARAPGPGFVALKRLPPELRWRVAVDLSRQGLL